VGIERVKVCIERTLCRVQGEEYQEEDTHRVVEHSVENTQQGVL
jgi:hypothetical protein